MGKDNRTMRLSIVSPDPGETTVAQFKNKADELGIDAAVVPVTLYDIASGEADKKLGNCVLWRLSSLGPSGNGAGYGLMDGRISINSSLYVMPEIGNKYFQQQVLKHSALSEYAVPTFYVGSYEQLEHLVNKGLLEYPVVIKPVHGSSAQGVAYLADESQARKHHSWDWQVAESYIENDGEWRVFVIGGVATGAMKKIAATGRKFNLVGPGATVLSEDDDNVRDEIYDLATKAASLFHTELNGVDIVRDKRTGRLYIFEVNVSPGWQNRFDTTTGEDIPARVMEWFGERLAKDDIGLPDAVQTYLLRRSYRLPLVDELRLLDILYNHSSTARMIFGMHHKRLLGDNNERIKRVVSEALKGSDLQREAALRAVTIMKRRCGYQPSDILGHDVWQQLERYNKDNQDTTQDLPEWERRIEQDLFGTPLEQQLEFLVSARQHHYMTKLESVILQYAATCCSWAGNFLVDDRATRATTGLSTAHTLRNGYYASALYVALMMQ